MPPDVRDAEIDALAARVKDLIGVATKSEAMKVALRHEIERASPKALLLERLRPAWDLIDSMGPRDPDFDMKAFTDEMWGD